MKKGVLLVNIGTPDSPRRYDVYKYLKQFLLDPRVIDINPLSRNFLVRAIIAPFRSKNTSELYKKLWTKNGSPLKTYGINVVAGVQEKLGNEYIVKLAMRYQNPSMLRVLSEFKKLNVSEIIVMPLFPQYASASTGSVHEEVMRIMSKELTIPKLKLINSYFDHPLMIEVFANNAKRYNLAQYDHFIFSFHGLPQRQLTKSDPTGNYCLTSKNCCRTINDKNKFCYSAQCYDTAKKIASHLKLNPEQYTISFQSRLGKDPWQQPYTISKIEEFAKKGFKNLLVFSPSFVTDCLETTIEIAHEYNLDFQKFGGDKIDLVESLNDNPKWIDAIANIILKA